MTAACTSSSASPVATDDPNLSTLVVPLPVAVATLLSYADEVEQSRGWGLEASEVAERLRLLAGLLQRAQVLPADGRDS